MKAVNIGILGLGTVGGGTVNVLADNQHEIEKKTGCTIKVVKASARDLTRERICSTDHFELTEDTQSIINDPAIDIVLELMGGDEPAKSLIIEALNNGKHVVTANKALIAKYGNELFDVARRNNVVLAYEAAIAGGIPIVKALREGLAANSIDWLAGIINGTGNFILTEMRDKGSAFEAVLKEAQELGYAEADPTFDVEGIDAAHKLCILGSIAFGLPLDFEKVFTEGISKVTPIDVDYAKELGYQIKHLGIAKKTTSGVELRVHPTLIPKERLIANVDGVMNAVVVNGNAVGSTLYYGPGAGDLATASAVVADVIDIARHLKSPSDHPRVSALGFQDDRLQPLEILPIEKVESAFYLRLQADDKTGVMAAITKVLADFGISIEAVLQKEIKNDHSQSQIIILTNVIVEQAMIDAITQLTELDAVAESVSRIRVESL